MSTHAGVDDDHEPAMTALLAAHLPQALALSSALGWPYRLEDWAFAHGLGQGLALEQDGRLIGTAMRWDYGAEYGSVGMIIVANAFKGRGYGARLVDTLLAGAGPRNLFLNATQEALELYRRRGFVITGELQQHQGVLAPTGSAAPPAWIRTAEAADFARIMKLDLAALGMPRHELLRRLMESGTMLMLGDRGEESGYATCRAFGRGHVIGPVVAASIEDARALIEAAMSRLQGQFVRVDTPRELGLGPWLEARGLARVDTASAMVRGALPEATGPSRVYALCSQSLG